MGPSTRRGISGCWAACDARIWANRAAARAFYWDMLVTGCVAAVCMLRGLPAGEALLYGILSGWAAAVAVQALSVAYYQMKESWGLGHDPE